ncbi:hypothetical protein [Actinocorallia aurantiaca]
MIEHTPTTAPEAEATSKNTRRFIARCVHFRHALRPDTRTDSREAL